MSTWEFDLHEDAVVAHLDAHSDDAASLMGEHLLQVSRTLVPIEEGTLERSGRVTDPEDGAVNVLYDTPYAVVQHEEMDYAHDAGRQAKYLEQPLHTERSVLAEIARRELEL